MNENWSKHGKGRLVLEKFLPMSRMNWEHMKNIGKFGVSGPSECKIIGIAHDVQVGGYFIFAETLLKSANFCWRHKVHDAENYVAGCLTRQHFKGSNQKSFSEPSLNDMLEV